MNLAALAGGTLKYGYSGMGARTIIGDIPMGALEVFTNTGGKFVKRDGSGYFDVCVGGDEDIYGWAECTAFTCGSVNGKSKVPVDTSLNSIYIIPADDTVSDTLIGQVGSLIVDSNRQRFDVATNSGSNLFVHAVDITNQLVAVSIVAGIRDENTI